MPESHRPRRRLYGRAIDAALRAYSTIAPTGQGAYRLARLARRFHPASDQVGRFQTPDGLRFDLDLRTYRDCCMAFSLYELDTDVRAAVDESIAGTSDRAGEVELHMIATAGMKETLRRSRPAVIVDLNATTLGRGGFSPREPLERLLAAVAQYESFVVAWRLRRARDVERPGEVNLLFP